MQIVAYWSSMKDFLAKFIMPKRKKRWKVGDKCNVLMPSGRLISGGIVASIQLKYKTCKVNFPDTNSHFLVDLLSLQ
ncbi:MAG: hypothetical protein ACYT04_86330 [Nostoc sp.]